MADKKPRHRSPNYPAISLRAAVGKAEVIYKADGTASTTRDGVLAHLGYEKPHSLAMKVLSALKKFGLLSIDNGRYKLSQRAIDIVACDESDPLRTKSLRDAALSPTIYRELIKEYNAAGHLPSDSSLRADLKAVRHFNANAVDGFISDLKDSLEFSGLSDFSMLNMDDEDGTHAFVEEGRTDQPVNQLTKQESPGRSIVSQMRMQDSGGVELKDAQTGEVVASRSFQRPTQIQVPVFLANDRAIVATVDFGEPISHQLLVALRRALASLEKPKD